MRSDHTRPEITDHARMRMQQRGITEADVEALLDHGVEKPDGKGAVVYLDKRGRQALRKCEKRLRGIYLVLSKDRTRVVTVAHRTRNLRLH